MNPDEGFPEFFVSVSEKLGRYSGYDEAAKAIAKYFYPSKFREVLDVCCGVGHFCSALSNAGYQTTGIDLSEPQIAVAKSSYPTLCFQIGDMASLMEAKFDLLTNVYTSFGYMRSAKQDFGLLQHWHSRLRKGGGLVMELADMDRARARLPASGQLERITGEITEHLSFDWRTNLLDVRYVDGTGAEWNCTTRIYERNTIVSALQEAGFTDIECFGGFDGRKKAPDDNLVIFAVRT